jgi:DNA repair exonuclease SbcCD ATPase subunit
MADTLEQIAEHLQKAIEWAESSGQRSQSAEIPGLKADLKASILKRSKRDMDLAREHTTHVLAALQSLAQEREMFCGCRHYGDGTGTECAAHEEQRNELEELREAYDACKRDFMATLKKHQQDLNEWIEVSHDRSIKMEALDKDRDAWHAAFEAELRAKHALQDKLRDYKQMMKEQRDGFFAEARVARRLLDFAKHDPKCAMIIVSGARYCDCGYQKVKDAYDAMMRIDE